MKRTLYKIEMDDGLPKDFFEAKKESDDIISIRTSLSGAVLSERIAAWQDEQEKEKQVEEEEETVTVEVAMKEITSVSDDFKVTKEELAMMKSGELPERIEDELSRMLRNEDPWRDYCVRDECETEIVPWSD